VDTNWTGGELGQLMCRGDSCERGLTRGSVRWRDIGVWHLDIIIDLNITQGGSCRCHVSLCKVSLHHFARESTRSHVRPNTVSMINSVNALLCMYGTYRPTCVRACAGGVVWAVHGSETTRHDTHREVMATEALSLSTRLTFWNSSITSPTSTYL
jgi:hypothetical protein